MGTWSHEPFGNDTANDWASELEGTTDLSVIEKTIDNVLIADRYIGALEATKAVAAAEVIANLLGKSTQSDAYTEKIDAWVQQVSIKPSPALRTKAVQALQRIVGNKSELRDLWDEVPMGQVWLQSIAALQAAIRN